MSSSLARKWAARARAAAVALLPAALICGALTLLVWPVCQEQEDARLRDMLGKKLTRLALAMHAYHDQHGALPPHALFDKGGRPLLSWRVLLLPHLDEEKLYRQFKLDEPWDSPHNKNLLEQMPDVYLHPIPAAREEPFSTNFQVFVGKGAAFEGQRGLRIPWNFPDGTSNTILIAEAARAVPWTKPEDLAYAPDQPLPKLGGFIRGGGFYAALGDASVEQFLQETSEATLRAFITRNGNDKPGPDWDR